MAVGRESARMSRKTGAKSSVCAIAMDVVTLLSSVGKKYVPCGYAGWSWRWPPTCRVAPSAHLPDLGQDDVDELVVYAGQGDDPLDADAVLAGGLEDATQEDRGDFFEVRNRRRVVEDDDRVFTTQLDRHGRECFRGGCADFVRDFPRADEGYVPDARMGREMVGYVWQADHILDEVGTVPTCRQSSLDDIREILAAPASLFRWLDDNGIASEQGRYDRRDEIVEWVVPADTRRHHAQRFIHDSILLVAHEKVCRSW